MDLAMAGLPPNKMGLESPPNNAMTSSFVGSKLWDKSIIYDPDFALEYMTGIDDYIGNKSPSEAASSPNKNYTNLESSDSNDSFSKYGFSTNIKQIFNNNPEPLLQTPPYRPEYIDPITDQSKSYGNDGKASDAYSMIGAPNLMDASSASPDHGTFNSPMPDFSVLGAIGRDTEAEAEEFKVSTIGIRSTASLKGSMAKTQNSAKKRQYPDSDETDSVSKVTLSRKNSAADKMSKSIFSTNSSDSEEEIKTKKAKRKPKSKDSGDGKKESRKKKKSKSALFAYDDGEFDPEMHGFTGDDLKACPINTKGQKIYVPPHMKDDRYWARREKNNMAAKRSRDARRMKENQIAMRAKFLEDQHQNMCEEVAEARKTIASLRKRLSRYEPV